MSASRMRSTRDLLRRRLYLVRKHAEILGHIKNTRHQYNMPAFEKRIDCACNREDVAERFDEPMVSASIEVDAQLLDSLHEQLDRRASGPPAATGKSAKPISAGPSVRRRVCFCEVATRHKPGIRSRSAGTAKRRRCRSSRSGSSARSIPCSNAGPPQACEAMIGPTLRSFSDIHELATGGWMMF
jgi:hypothetical protein